MGKSKLFTEQVLEIKYRPEPRVLDHLGLWADQLLKEYQLTEWQITQSRLDVFDKQETNRLFISFKNAGLVLRNSTDEHEFLAKTRTFLKFLLKQNPFNTKFSIERLGVLSKFAYEYNGMFDDLRTHISKNLYSINEKYLNLFDGKLTDFAIPLTFQTESGKTNSHLGPMKKDQLKVFLPFVDELPDVCLYFDIDHALTPEDNQSLDIKKLPKTIDEYIQSNWAHYYRLLKLIE
jgi:hypothetical protein